MDRTQKLADLAVELAEQIEMSGFVYRNESKIRKICDEIFAIRREIAELEAGVKRDILEINKSCSTCVSWQPNGSWGSGFCAHYNENCSEGRGKYCAAHRLKYYA